MRSLNAGLGVAWLLVVFALPGALGQDEPAESEGSKDDDDAKPDWSVERYLEEAHSWGDLSISSGPEYMVITWSGIELGSNASADLRELADGALSGEKDGEVDAQELEDLTFALTALLESEFGKYANHHRFSGLLLIDEAEAQGADVSGVDIGGMEGPVDQDGLVTFAFQVDVAFPNVDASKDIHTVRLDLGKYYIKEGSEEAAAKFGGDLTLTIQGIDGWTLDHASVQPDCAGEGQEGNRLVYEGDDVACFTGRSGLLLSFAITGEGESKKSFLPGFELPAIVGGLALAGILVRRKA